MNANQLRASILQMAIEGKLVPQLDSEPAVEQLGNAPEDVPFDIPEKWKWASIDSAIKIVRGGSPRPIKKFLTDSANGINWIKIGDADKGKSLINSTKERIVPEGVNKSRFVKKGSLLLTNSMSFGYPYILNIDGCIHDGWLALFDFEQYLFRDYLFYVLLSPYMRSSFVNKAVGTGVKNLNIDRVRSLFIPIPSLEEQKRIVAKLEQLLPLVDEYGKAYEMLEELNTEFPDKLKASVLQSAIKGQLVPQLDSEPAVEQLGKAPEDVPFDIPEKWKWLYLSNVGRWKSGGTPDRSKHEYYDNGNIPWLKTGDLNDGFIDSVEECITQLGLDNSSAHINPIGSVLIAMYGATIGKLGILNIPCATNQACCACVTEDKIIFNKFLFFYLLSQRRHLVALGAGSGQPNISKTKIINYPIPLPPLEEQKRIVAKVEELFALIDAMKK